MAAFACNAAFYLYIYYLQTDIKKGTLSEESVPVLFSSQLRARSSYQSLLQQHDLLDGAVWTGTNAHEVHA